MAKIKIDRILCKKCGICAFVCPKKVFKFIFKGLRGLIGGKWVTSVKVRKKFKESSLVCITVNQIK
jgi:NAD-dependent dihydropyrimidine dehydrogenase PreA subunit